MSEKWPKAVVLQALILISTIVLGGFLIDGIDPNLWPRTLFGYLLSSVPALLLIPWLNRQDDYLCFLSRSKAKEDIPTILVAGQSISVKDVGDDEEQRFLNTHGDLGRRSRLMISFWGQLIISFLAIYFVHPSPSIGAITVCGAGLAMVLSFGQGHLLIIPAVQALLIMARIEGPTVATPILLFIYTSFFVSLLCGAFLLNIRESSNRPFEFLFRGTATAVVLVLFFLAIDMVIPSNEKWWEKLLKLTMPKKVEMVDSSKAKTKSKSFDLSGVAKFAQTPKLSADQIFSKLDQLELMMSKMEGVLSGLDIPEFDMSRGEITSVRSGLELARFEGSNFDPTRLAELEGRLKRLQGSLKRLSKKMDLIKASSTDPGKIRKLDQFKESLNEMGKELEFKMPPPSKMKLNLKRMGSVVKSIEVEKKKKKKLLNEKNLKRILWAAITLIVFVIGRAIFRRVKAENVLSEEELEVKDETRKLYNKERRKWKSGREEILKSYSIFHRGVEKLDYAPLGTLAPPPAILVCEYRGDRKNLEVVGSIFSDVQYGNYDVTKKDVRQFRKSFKRLI